MAEVQISTSEKKDKKSEGTVFENVFSYIMPSGSIQTCATHKESVKDLFTSHPYCKLVSPTGISYFLSNGRVYPYKLVRGVTYRLVNLQKNQTQFKKELLIAKLEREEYERQESKELGLDKSPSGNVVQRIKAISFEDYFEPIENEPIMDEDFSSADEASSDGYSEDEAVTSAAQQASLQKIGSSVNDSKTDPSKASLFKSGFLVVPPYKSKKTVKSKKKDGEGNDVTETKTRVTKSAPITDIRQYSALSLTDARKRAAVLAQSSQAQASQSMMLLQPLTLKDMTDELLNIKEGQYEREMLLALVSKKP